MRAFYHTVLIALAVYGSAFAQTIAEKKAGSKGPRSDLTEEMQGFLSDVNNSLMGEQQELFHLYKQVAILYEEGAPPEAYQALLTEINEIRTNIEAMEESWRETVAKGTAQGDAYALWHQPDTTIEQLVIDFGSQDFVYLIPPDIATLPLSISSNIPIPRASWGLMLEEILAQNGIGIEQINPFLRKLYQLQHDHSGVRLITNKRSDLAVLPPQSRVSFVLSPEPAELQRVWFFLDKFANPNTTSLQLTGRDILMIAPAIEVKELLKIYDFVQGNSGGTDYKVIPLRRVQPEEMAHVLSTIFGQLHHHQGGTEGSGKSKRDGGKKGDNLSITVTGVEGNGLRVVALSNIANALFLIGTEEEIRKAEEIIQQVEDQVGEARQKVIYRYVAKHSEPEELALVLERIYHLMIETGTGISPEQTEEELIEEELRDIKKTLQETRVVNIDNEQNPLPQPEDFYGQTFYQQGGYIVNPAPIEPQRPVKRDPNKGRDNFIVDNKSGSIVMVVERDILPKLKELLRKLDVPKKMVQIEVMLFERRLNREDNFGLNLLKIGGKASQERLTSVCWNDTVVDGQLVPENAGVLEFFLSRPKTGFPAYDIAYKFMISQDDIQLNASPSVVAVNQTPATITIRDEISVNTGIFQVQTQGGVTLEQAFTRAQYGITITVTPTIHTVDDFDFDEDFFFEEEGDSVTLVTDITFDTFKTGSAASSRPDVNRRNVVNEVRIPNGQSVIIGGLRNKEIQDRKDAIPFLGEIPGIGKLFSTNSMMDKNTEMFIFITPKIIYDPSEDFRRIRRLELCKRPGDIPEYLCSLNEAWDREKNRALQGTMTMVLGRRQPRCICTDGEYDGR